MPDLVRAVLTAVLAYLLGSLNGALLTSRLLHGDDIRRHGSGNAGATNMLRTYGLKGLLPVMLFDAGKGVAAVLAAGRIFDGGIPGGPGGPLIAGVFVIAGHVFPVFFGFRGGKGVLTACAVMFALDWPVAALSLGFFLLLAVLFRYISLGSICAVLTLPCLGLLFGRSAAAVAVYAVIAALIIWLHRENITRLAEGAENRFPGEKTARRDGF